MCLQPEKPPCLCPALIQPSDPYGCPGCRCHSASGRCKVLHGDPSLTPGRFPDLQIISRLLLLALRVSNGYLKLPSLHTVTGSHRILTCFPLDKRICGNPFLSPDALYSHCGHSSKNHFRCQSTCIMPGLCRAYQFSSLPFAMPLSFS